MTILSPIMNPFKLSKILEMILCFLAKKPQKILKPKKSRKLPKIRRPNTKFGMENNKLTVIFMKSKIK